MKLSSPLRVVWIDHVQDGAENANAEAANLQQLARETLVVVHAQQDVIYRCRRERKLARNAITRVLTQVVVAQRRQLFAESERHIHAPIVARRGIQ